MVDKLDIKNFNSQKSPKNEDNSERVNLDVKKAIITELKQVFKDYPYFLLTTQENMINPTSKKLFYPSLVELLGNPKENDVNGGHLSIDGYSNLFITINELIDATNKNTTKSHIPQESILLICYTQEDLIPETQFEKYDPATYKKSIILTKGDFPKDLHESFSNFCKYLGEIEKETSK